MTTLVAAATAWFATCVSAAGLLYVHGAILRSGGASPSRLERALVVLAFALGAGAGAIHGPVTAAATAGAASAGAVAVILDLRAGLVPDLSSAVIAVAGLAAAQYLNPALDWLTMLLGAASAAGVLGLAGAYMRWRRGVAGLGAGDLLLAAALGVWCGPQAAALGVGIAAGVTLAAAVARRAGRADRLAFAPGLVGGCLCVIVWNASWVA